MKKLALMLALSLCFGITNVANAACPCSHPEPKTTCKTCKPCEKPCKVKCEVCKGCPDLSKCWYDQNQEIYNRLKLTCDQRAKADCLYNKYKPRFDNIKDNIKCEKNKLCCLINSCACKDDIHASMDRIKCLKKDIKAEMKDHCKEFECILDDCQRKQYKQIKKEYKKQVKLYSKANCWCVWSHE